MKGAFGNEGALPLSTLGLSRQTFGVSAEEVGKFVMSSDPKPDYRIPSALADGPILIRDSHAPQVGMGGQFLESKRRVVGILFE